MIRWKRMTVSSSVELSRSAGLLPFLVIQPSPSKSPAAQAISCIGLSLSTVDNVDNTSDGTLIRFDDASRGNLSGMAAQPTFEYGPDVSTIRLTIPAKPEYIALGRLALAGISRVRPLSDETLADLKLALTEA